MILSNKTAMAPASVNKGISFPNPVKYTIVAYCYNTLVVSIVVIILSHLVSLLNTVSEVVS